ncbi:hypothetical protein LCGC14_2612640, partial [marine sediment metagenome]
SPYASGTVTIQNPSDSTVKASYPTAADADASTNGTSADVSLNARGQPDQDLWGKDNEDYKIIVKDSDAATVDTFTKIRMPRASRRATVTFGSTDATPTIRESETFITAGTTAITDFDNGEVGDVIQILAATSKKITHGALISLRGEVSFSMVAGDTLTLAMFNDQVWEEIGRTYAKAFTKFKTADESLTSTTLADDTHLKDWALQPNTYYRFEGYLKVNADNTSRDLEMNITTDNAFVEECYSWISVDAGNALAVDQGETSALTTAVGIIDIDGTGLVGILIKGFVLTHATSACNVDVQFANQAGTGTTTVHKGSWVSFIPYEY